MSNVQIITLANGNRCLFYKKTKDVCNKIIAYFIEHPNVNKIVMQDLADAINIRPNTVKHALFYLTMVIDKKPLVRLDCSHKLMNNDGLVFYRQFVVFIGDRKILTRKNK